MFLKSQQTDLIRHLYVPYNRRRLIVQGGLEIKVQALFSWHFSGINQDVTQSLAADALPPAWVAYFTSCADTHSRP